MAKFVKLLVAVRQVLSGVKPTAPRLFRVELILTARDVRDLEILVLGRQCLANDIGGASRVAYSCRPRTSFFVSLQSLDPLN